LKNSLFVKVPSFIALVLVGGAMIVFSVVNRHTVRLDFWPLDLAPDVRLFAVVLGVLTIGVLWGGIAAWLAGTAPRRRGRDAGRRAEAAETEVRALKQRISRVEGELSELRRASKISLPALPPADAA